MYGGFFCTQTPSQSEFMEVNLWNFSIVQLILCRLSLWASAARFAYGAASIFWRDTGRTTRQAMLMYGKEASNRKQEIDRQYHTIPNHRSQKPKDKHRGNVYNLLFRHGKACSQNMEKLKGSFPTFCKQTFPQPHKPASYAHYAQCRLLRNLFHPYVIKKTYVNFPLDFNIIYVILNFVKSNMKGELNWRLTRYHRGY